VKDIVWRQKQLNINDYTLKPENIININNSGLDCIWCGCDIEINKTHSYKLEINEIIDNPLNNKVYEYNEVIYPLCDDCYDFLTGEA
jgi:hypothetical protein